MPLRLFTRENFHRPQTFAIACQQSQFFSDCFSRTNGNNNSIYAIMNYGRTGGGRGSNNRCPLRHRFGNGKAESLEKRWKNEDVVLSHFAQDLGVTQAGQPAVSSHGLIEWATTFDRFS